MIQVGVNLIDMIWVSADLIQIDVILNFNIFAPAFFNLKTILPPIFLKIMLPTVFSLSLINAAFHNALLLVKSNVILMG